jgi:hypothetical protein
MKKMRSNVMGVQPLYSLAEELLDAGVPVDVVDLSTGAGAVPRTDKAVVMTLLEACGDADLVVPLGAASGLVALEVDEANGGTESLRALMKNLEIPNTPIVKTANGLVYFLMRTDATTQSSRDVLGSGLALLANERYIVVPPKDSADRTQGWWKNFPTEVEVAPVPEKLAGLL